MPVIGPDGAVLGILAGLDRSAVAVPPESLGVLRAIADSLGASDALRDQLTRETRPEVAASNGVEGADAAGRSAAGTGPGPEAEPGRGRGHLGPEPAPAGEPDQEAERRPAGGAGPIGGPAPTGEPAIAGSPAREASQAPSPQPGTRLGQPGPAAPEPAPGTPRVTPEVLARAVRSGPPARPGAPRPAPPRSGPPRPGVARGPSGAAGGGAPGHGAADMRLRRAPAGWIVEGPGSEIRPVGDLISAMVLADLLAEDLSPPGRPRRADRDLNETEQLRLSVIQLEHALASRVIVEQAIGVLAERNHIKPRDAFERLRRTARGMGRRVHDLARQVVDSVGDPRVNLPGELGRGGSGPPPGPASGGPGGGTPRPSPPRATPSRR
ncbi:ANTAR domain-containing protein [Frankia sp. EI5c]|uniref:ANTAR domain-containing protein n=1 Tax=Frankia sp. EI5c TaxID=683316 RepID=UPI0028C3DD1C|nr:ANTAR domain-containing protein [Frankia sp. EI5c]